MFDKLREKYGQFEVDLFADSSNYKVDTYVSWLNDTLAYAVDVFSIRRDR